MNLSKGERKSNAKKVLKLKGEIEDSLAGSDEVINQINHLLSAFDPQLSRDIYKTSSRAKEARSVLNKINDSRENGEDYNLENVKDLIGMRFVVLYGDRLTEGFKLVKTLIKMGLNRKFGLFQLPRTGGDRFIDIVDTITVYRRNSSKDDPYGRFYDELCQEYPNYISATGIEGGKINALSKEDSSYSSIHINLSIRSRVSGKYKSFPLEIQIRTALEDIWADISHELLYKRKTNITDENTQYLLKLGDGYLGLFKAGVDLASQQADSLKSLFDRIDDKSSNGSLSIVADEKEELFPIYYLNKVFDNSALDKENYIDSVLRIDRILKNQRRTNQQTYQLSDEEDLFNETSFIVADIEVNEKLEDELKIRIVDVLNLFLIYVMIENIVSMKKGRLDETDRIRLNDIYNESKDKFGAVVSIRNFVLLKIVREIGTSRQERNLLREARGKITSDGVVSGRLIEVKILRRLAQIIWRIREQENLNPENGILVDEKAIFDTLTEAIELSIEAMNMWNNLDEKLRSESSENYIIAENSFIYLRKIFDNKDGKNKPEWTNFISECAKLIVEREDKKKQEKSNAAKVMEEEPLRPEGRGKERRLVELYVLHLAYSHLGESKKSKGVKKRFDERYKDLRTGKVSAKLKSFKESIDAVVDFSFDF